MKELTQAALAAKEIRAILKRQFPSIKFSITSRNFANGSSVNVRWINGPTVAQVDPLVEQYEYHTFDPMTDCSGVKNCDFKGPQAAFVMCKRTISDSIRTTVEFAESQRWGDWLSISAYERDRRINQILNSTSYEN